LAAAAPAAAGGIVSEHPIRWLSREPASAEAIAARAEAMRGYAQARSDRINERAGPHYKARLDATLARLRRDSRSTRSKIRELWRIADGFGSFTGEDVACRRGCSHCCHIAVSVPKQEAQLIGELIGRKPEPAPLRISFEHVSWGYHNPCGFLRDGECSIYEHRPLACRVHYSVDTDDLMCRLDPPHTNRVPFLNTARFTYALVDIVAEGSFPHFADIREWFPASGTGATE
jgi:hypothetical protein